MGFKVHHITDEGGDIYPSDIVRYPWDKMEPGSWFFVPNKKSSQMSGAIASRSRSHNEKFTCRTVDGGVRIWRKE